MVLIALQKPFKGSNLVEMGHEVVILLIMYHMFCFTEFVPDPEVRNLIGYSVVTITFLHLFAFYALRIYFAIKAAIQKCRMNATMRKSKNSIQQNEIKRANKRIIVDRVEFTKLQVLKGNSSDPS